MTVTAVILAKYSELVCRVLGRRKKAGKPKGSTVITPSGGTCKRYFQGIICHSVVFHETALLLETA